MSSFVVGKRELVKCAGFLAGLSECQRMHEPLLRVWSKTYDKVMEPEDFYRDFCKIYDLNALSVMEQYGDQDRETDSNDYMSEFNSYRMAAKGMFSHGQYADLALNIDKAVRFLNSVHYQIEIGKYEKQFLNIANKFYRELWKVSTFLRGHADRVAFCWGCLTFDPNDEN